MMEIKKEDTIYDDTITLYYPMKETDHRQGRHAWTVNIRFISN